MKHIILIMVVILTANSAFAVNLQSAANDVCACLESPYALIEKALKDVRQAQASGDYTKLTKAQEEMMSVMSTTTECFAKLPEKYPEIDKNQSLQKEVMAIANKQCPNPAENFGR